MKTFVKLTKLVGLIVAILAALVVAPFTITGKLLTHFFMLLVEETFGNIAGLLSSYRASNLQDKIMHGKVTSLRESLLEQMEEIRKNSVKTTEAKSDVANTNKEEIKEEQNGPQPSNN